MGYRTFPKVKVYLTDYKTFSGKRYKLLITGYRKPTKGWIESYKEKGYKYFKSYRNPADGSEWGLYGRK